jgi:signal transduction histidine kinase
MSDSAVVKSHADYRKRLLAASIPATAATVFLATFVFEGMMALTAPGRVLHEWLPNIIQLAVPALLWWLSRGPMGDRPATLLLGADFAYTATLIGRLLLPATSASGTALYICVKMLATALLVPWGQRRQTISVAFSLTMLLGGLWLSGADLHGTELSHRWLGPLIAGLLSIAGAAAGSRAQRSVFDRERQLEDAAERLEREVEIEEALARVGRELIALPDTPRILDALCRLTTEVLACDASHTYLWDGERREYAAAAGYGDTPEQWEALRLVRYPEPMVSTFHQRIETADVEQFVLTDRGKQTALLREFGTRVLLCVALRRGDKLIGVQSAERRTQAGAFSPYQVRIARGIAHLASLALETARLVEELAAANHLKSEFVATMSHELRSPLNIIIGYHDLLLDGSFGPLSDAQRDSLRRADRSARELLDLVNATLDLSRLQAKRLAPDIDEVAVAELIDDIAREFGDVLQRPNVEVRWEVAPDLPVLRTDRVKLKMVLKNLVGNAVKFTDHGRVTVQARTHGGGIEFRITDTGIGIPPEARATIFEPFRQIDSGPGRPRGGAGLGLYIVKQLLTALGGSVMVESELGRGSTFSVWVPFQATADPGYTSTGAGRASATPAASPRPRQATG